MTVPVINCVGSGDMCVRSCESEFTTVPVINCVASGDMCVTSCESEFTTVLVINCVVSGDVCVRSCESEFTTVLVKWQLTSAGRDTHLQWRCLAWSWDASMLAVASSCGAVDVYDAVLGTALCTIPPVSTVGKQLAVSQ